jgi:hypothetical protein
MRGRSTLLLALVLLGCAGAPTEPEAPTLKRPNAAVTVVRVTTTPAAISSLVGEKDTVVGTVFNSDGTVCKTCLIAWRLLDSTKIKILSTFVPSGQSKPNAAVVQSLAVGATGLRGGSTGFADTTAFTISSVIPPTGVQAAWSDSFVNSISMQLHLGQGGIYDQFTTIVKPRLLELGVRHIRERMFNDAGTQAQAQDLAASGIKMTAGCWPIGTVYTDASHCIDYANAYGTGTIDAFDGWNEVNGRGVADWETAWVQWQQAMWDVYGADATWNNRPVLANSFTSTAATSQLATDKGNQSNKADKGNMHSYPGGGSTPTGVLGNWITAQNAVTGPKPIWVTETGYHTCVPNCSDGSTGVSELAQGKYTPRIFFEDWNRSIERTNLYELLDEQGEVGREAHWGLVRADNTVKPAFTALKNVIALLSDQGATFAAGQLDYTLTGALSTTHTTLLQKRDGRFYLVIWQDLNVYDPVAEADRVNAADGLTLTLGQSHTVNTYLPRVNLTATPKGAGTSFSLNVPDEVFVVEII